MRVSFLTYLITVVAVALVLAGCGGSAKDVDDSGGTNMANAQPKQQNKQQNVSFDPPIVWQADFETGDLSQWLINSPKGIAIKEDSGKCTRPSSGVSTEHAHSGIYSMMMTIDSTKTAGCRQFRKPESITGQSYYYSAWYFIPELVQVDGNWNIFQFKAQLNKKSDVFWKLEIRNNGAGQMVVVPVWKGPIAGPHAGDAVDNKLYYQTKATISVGKWFHLEVFLKQSEEFDGQITVWQDGIELLNENNVRTKWPRSEQSWSVNNYGTNLEPNPTTLYIDDVVVSSNRIGQ